MDQASKPISNSLYTRDFLNYLLKSQMKKKTVEVRNYFLESQLARQIKENIPELFP